MSTTDDESNSIVYCSECGDPDCQGECMGDDDFNEYLEELDDPYFYEMSGEQETLILRKPEENAKE